jgi:hypothetical protein
MPSLIQIKAVPGVTLSFHCALGTWISATACWQRRHEKSVMRDACVLGIGQGVFGKFPQRSVATLGCGAARAALKDAGIEALHCGRFMPISNFPK